MCSLDYHNCPICQEEYRCDQSNYECPILNHLVDDAPCNKCERWVEDFEDGAEKAHKRAEWIKDNGWDYED